MAAVFAGTLLAYLVVTAIPAAALSTCTTSGGNHIIIQLDTDARVIVDPAQFLGVNYGLAQDGSAVPVNCGLAPGGKWVDIRGTDNGTETVVLYEPRFMSGDNVTVNLGNGSDTLILANGATSWNQTGVVVIQFPDDASSTDQVFGVSGTTAVANFNVGGGTSGDLRVDNAENIVVNGGAGADRVDAGLQSGISASSVIAIETGDNVPTATGQLDRAITFNGEADNDTFISGLGADTFNGGSGTDLVDYIAATSGATVDLTAGTGASDLLVDVQNANGSNFDDIITGSPLDNTLDGVSGNDIVDGAGGNDTVLGSGGDDTLRGGDGNDTVVGGTGDDTIDEGAAANGADSLQGGSGGETAGDTLDHSARTTPVTVTAGSGPGNDGAAGEGDTVLGDFENYLGGSAADHYEGTNNNERFQPNGGDDFVDGNGAGGDLLDISESTVDTTVDLPNGTANGDGNDTFVDIEAVATGSGNDTVLWDGLTPLVNFIADGGVDTVDASQATVGVSINLSAFGNGNEVENATGGSGNDTLTGNALNNVLLGNDGIDVISAGLGNDFVEGGLGNDSISDGGGADTLSYRHATGGETIDTRNGFASGPDGEDSIAGIFETILGSNFDDNITGGQSSVDVPNRLQGFQGDDIITGTNSTDLVRGGPGNDELRAGAGDDTVRGAGGNDLLIAGAGDDRLLGGAGNDHGVGGRGFDVCNGIEFQQSCEV